MKIPRWLENSFLDLVDRVYSWIPQKKPSLEKLQQVKIVAHRGVHDKQRVENTFAAFDRALELGLWGIEFDIRWTKDLVPMVHHDADCRRVFQQDIKIADIEFSELRAKLPQIPSLEEVLQRYGKKIHLMVEIKEEPYPDSLRQDAILQSLFSNLKPCVDYHFISLVPAMFEHIKFVPSECFFPIAAINSRPFAELIIAKNHGGLLGHYFFVGDQLIKLLQSKGRQVGFGFVSSKNSLYRELNRGIDWVYTNNPELLLAVIANAAV